MSYADSLLSTGERITHRVRQHWLVLLWGSRVPIAAILGALLILVLSSAAGATGTARDLLFWLFAILFLGGLAFLAWATLRYLNTEFVLTNRRILQVEGVVNKRATDSSLEKINDAVLTQSIFGLMFGFGDLDVLTAAEAGIERFRMIIDPVGFKRAMLDAKHEYEVDMERAGWQPSPPIRAATAPAAATTPARPGPTSTGSGSPTGASPGEPPAEPPVEPAAGAASASPAAPAPGAPAVAGPASPVVHKVNPDEVTRTLAKLADLRDRGAISEEEYEAKKTDLLSRL
ncbi:MAG TPA: PH domain-containing protein [Candidatus Limnocylindrales bacterium]|nr:PH domain-containing protein [Candidatus Limnocylindrales bacterium]